MLLKNILQRQIKHRKLDAIRSIHILYYTFHNCVSSAPCKDYAYHSESYSREELQMKKKDLIISICVLAVLIISSVITKHIGLTNNTYTYTYEESVEEMSKPYLTLDKEDQKFQFFWSMFSSYIAQGTYEVKDNEIICKTDDVNNVYTFEILDDGGYRFIENKSSIIPKYKYSSDAEAPVIDGAIFD